LPGDEQWDDRITGAEGWGLGRLAVYRNEAYAGHLKWDGTKLSRWAPGSAGFLKTVRGNDLFVSGNAFSTYRLPSAVSRWDGTNWHAVGWDFMVSDYGRYISALEFLGDTLYAAGHLFSPQNSIIELRGDDWVNVQGGVTLFFPDYRGDSGYVWDMAVHRGSLYVAGHFHFAGGKAITNLARWDGTNWFDVGTSFIDPIYSLAFQGDDLLAKTATAVIKRSGTNLTLVGAVDGQLQEPGALTVHGSDIYLGGQFTSVNGVAATNIARWDGTNWWPLGSGLGGGLGRVWDILGWNNQIVVSGLFDTAGGKPSTNFAVWHLPAPRINVTTNHVEVSWWNGFTNYVLEASDTLPATNWTSIPTPANTNYYSAPASGTKGFFRLRQE
jgi:hypothetical protein